jgi:hypothetical protein
LGPVIIRKEHKKRDLDVIQKDPINATNVKNHVAKVNMIYK